MMATAISTPSRILTYTDEYWRKPAGVVWLPGRCVLAVKTVVARALHSTRLARLRPIRFVHFLI